MRRYLILISVLCALVLSCGRRSAGNPAAVSSYRHFPLVQVPSVCADEREAQVYLALHFWDDFFNGKGITDTSAVLGVRNAELEKMMADYAGLLYEVPMNDAQNGVGCLFDGICRAQRADTSSHVYLLMTGLVEKYLYDPNSPLRNEDFYLPFVRGMAACDLTDEVMIPSYEYQARMCSLNRYGTQAADFSYVTSAGRRGTLFGVKAESTILFFGNPGCEDCRNVTEALVSCPEINEMIDSGSLKILNVYIDRELDKWREHLSEYPSNWICCYDNRFVIREDVIYNIRAIPSLYLLDEEKKIVCKDAPVERVIDNLLNK